MNWFLPYDARRKASCHAGGHFGRLILAAIAFTAAPIRSAEPPAAAQFRKEIQPILEEYCFDCHADGTKKGEVVFDEFKSDEALLLPELWFHVLKNTRAGLMPPRNKPQLSADARQKLEHWIKFSAFGMDPQNPDPGRVTVRRLNRVEYRNTIRDLMGVDFNAEAEFPPDDTGYGFDNIGDVLTVSPMLLEKYLAAAREVVAQAVPIVDRVMPEKTVAGNRFRADEPNPGRNGGGRGNRPEGMLALGFYEPAAVSTTLRVDQAGSYQVTLELAVKGSFDFDPGKCRVTCQLNGRELLKKEFGWNENKTFRFDFDEKWEAGENRMSFNLEPLTPVEQKAHPPEMRLVQVTVRGPMEQEHWTVPKNYDRFFTRAAPGDAAERRRYAHDLLAKFAAKAFRRPVDDQTVDRLTTLAENFYRQSGKTFESGVAHAMVAVLASPRFLFHLEEAQDTKQSPPARFPPIDEYSLASRLSYFLWSTMPDQELIDLAAHGELRQNLPAQVKRMLADARAEKLFQNFTGQWLQTRDVEGISSNARVILARDSGQERELRQEDEAFRAQLAERAAARAAAANPFLAGFMNGIAGNNGAAQRPMLTRRFNKPRVELDRDLREAMRRETEMFFGSIVREDRPVTELIESDYTFLNEKLARLYGLADLHVAGAEMQRVTLPPDSPRGGVLTHGSALVVTSNPDRTSPVKRGLFVLENMLGTPTPPPPPNIPALEAADHDFKNHEPTLREALQEHREKPACASCHARMDPIGLAFENFNAMGMWRDQERKQAIETSGKLITGESFTSVRELKHILATEHRLDFYRCLTEKLLTYAIGRGTEFYDTETIDKIVERLERENGRFSALLMGVIESSPFQNMRPQATASASNDAAKDPATPTQVANCEPKP